MEKSFQEFQHKCTPRGQLSDGLAHLYHMMSPMGFPQNFIPFQIIILKSNDLEWNKVYNFTVHLLPRAFNILSSFDGKKWFNGDLMNN